MSIRIAACLLVIACGSRTLVPPTASTAIAFVDVNVVATRDGGATIVAGQTVLVEGDRIARVGPTAEVRVPAGAQVIRGTGHYLAPGFADMHVHLPDDAGELERVAALSLAQGVTLIRGMQGAPGQLVARRRLLADAAPWPELVLAGPPVADALTVDQAAELVRTQHAAGYDLIKILGGIDRAAYDAIVATAKQLRIPVAGHVPKEIGLAAALDSRQQTIEHLMGYLDGNLDALARTTAERKIWNCPTLDFFATALADDETLSRRDGLAYATAAERSAWVTARTSPVPDDAAARQARRYEVVAALARAGAPLLVGSDTPGTFAVPGFGYLEELRELARAGLRPDQLIAAATHSAAASLGRADLGSVAAGKRADLVLLTGNPLDKIDHVANPAGVMVRGRWQTRAELDRRIARYRAP